MSDSIRGDIRKLAAALKQPKDYFSGLRVPSFGLPTNILAFTRTRWTGKSTAEMHPRYMLILNLETAGTVVVDDVPLLLKPGQGLLIHPSHAHMYSKIESNSMFWVFVTFDLSGSSQWLSRLAAPVELCGEALTQARSVLAACSQGEAAPVACALASLLFEMLKAMPAAGAGVARTTAEEGLLKKITDFVWNNISSKIELKDIATHLHVSQGHLRNKFHELTGESLGAYHRKMQIWKAKELLSNSSANISQIAEQCGFSSVYSFSRAFSKAQGVSPQRYRAKSGK